MTMTTRRQHNTRMMNRMNMVVLLLLLGLLLHQSKAALAATTTTRKTTASSNVIATPSEATIIVGAMNTSPIITTTTTTTNTILSDDDHQHYHMRAAVTRRSSLPVFSPPRRRRTVSTSSSSSSSALLLYDPNISPPERAFDYYDSLRRTSNSNGSNATASSLFNVTPPVGNSQIYVVQDMTSNNTGNTTLFRMAEIKAFLPFSNTTHVRDGGATINDAFTVLLAIYHFNNMQTSTTSTTTTTLDADTATDTATTMITPYSLSRHADLQNCNVRLTTELVDTRFSPIETTRTFSSILQRPASFHEFPPPTAVVGALRSAVSSPLAILTGVSNITQVSHGSTAVDFDSKEQFPVFGRTVTSTVGEAAVAVSFFQSIASQYVAIIFVTDAYGSALQKSFQDAASAVGIQTESIAISFDLKTNSEEAKNAMQQLKQTQYRHVYGIFFEEQIEPLMTAAIEYDVVGSEYFYLFNKLLRSQYETLDPKSANIPLYHGAAIIQMQGGVLINTNTNTSNNNSNHHDQESNIVHHTAADEVVVTAPTTTIQETTTTTAAVDDATDDYYQDDDDDDESLGFEKFMASWTQALNDPGFVQHVRDKLPTSLDSMIGFDRQNSEFYVTAKELLPFLYDAVFTLGLSMCMAGKTVEFFNASDIFEQFRQLDVQGASGRVKIDPETGTRDYKTMSFVIWNSRVLDGLDENGQVVVEYYPTFKFHDGDWIPIPGSQPMVYADGSNMPPDALPPVEQNYNYIGKSGRIVGYLLMGMTIFTALLSLVWLVVNRHENVVRAAQPLFLILVSIGSIVTSSTIIPLSMEETTVANGEDGLDMACMSAPWLYILGMNIAFSALFAKTIGVHQAYMNPTLDFINVSMRDVFATAAVLLTPNVVVLLTWTLLSPLEWTRVQRSTTDIFGRHTESFGECASEDAYIYAIVICTINFIFLILGNWGTYQSRNIETEYNESRYIAVSLFAVLQAWCMGIPILAVTFDNPQGRFYVMSGIIFVTAQSILSLVYIPKILNLRQARKIAQKAEDPKRKAYAAYAHRRSGNPANNVAEDDEEEEQDESEKPSSGDEVPDMLSSNPMSSTVARPGQASGMSSRSLGASSGTSLSGIKVIHSPKKSRNLQLTGGIEMSREQLDYFLASGTPGAMSDVTGECDPRMQEGAVNANINTTGEALSRLDKARDETTHAESKKNEQSSGEGNSSIGIANNSEDAQQQQLPDDAAVAQGLPLQNVDEENHAAVRVEDKEETDDSSLPTDDDKVKDKAEGGDDAAAHATVAVVSDDEGGDTEDTGATTIDLLWSSYIHSTQQHDCI